ncbi:MAG: winged helix-turn-helix transcriptional regulator, partial [archaeon]|nr:winged helix-turn-helix transcriptional regulator [archaeon]
MKTENCALIGTGKLLGKKWGIMIVQELFFEKKAGFNKLKKSLKKISSRILSCRLKELEAAKLIKKTRGQKNNRGYSSYSLTKKGKELQHII